MTLATVISEESWGQGSRHSVGSSSPRWPYRLRGVGEVGGPLEGGAEDNGEEHLVAGCGARV